MSRGRAGAEAEPHARLDEIERAPRGLAFLPVALSFAVIVFAVL